MRKQKGKRTGRKIAAFFFVILIIVVLLGGANIATIYYGASLDESKIVAPSAKVKLLDTNKIEMSYHSSVNEYVQYEEISPYIINAFVGLEDKRFFKHNGIDLYRIGGAVVHNIKAKSLKEGASTISQQLAKNTQLSGEKTFNRKIKEMRMARQIERKFGKEQILEMYLNAIYFGGGIYGIDKACKTFFGKSAKDVTLPEAAMLAGVVRSPNNNSPINNESNAKQRLNLTLKVMLKNNLITYPEYEQALQYSYVRPIVQEKEKYSGKYAICAINEAAKLLGITEKALIENNFIIHTYMDSSLQEHTDNGLRIDSLLKEDKREIPTYIMVLDNSNFGISAFSANFDYDIFSLRRQPGSCIKPLLSYLPALEKGIITPASPIEDAPKSYNGYNPKNYKGIYYGNTDITSALIKSMNSVPVTLLNQLGLPYCKGVATNLGLRFTPEDDSLALALGGMYYGVTPLEICGAYATIADGGKSCNATFIDKIYNENGQLLYANSPQKKQVIAPSSAYLMTSMLKETPISGTARKLSGLNYQIAAKTGTVGYSTNDLNSDAWCMSYTSEHTVGVWSGNLHQRPEDRLPGSFTGGSMPALLSRFVYDGLYSLRKPNNFAVPNDVIMLDIDLKAREVQNELHLASPFTPVGFTKPYYFNIYNAPTTYSDIYNIVMPDDFSAVVIEGVPRISFSAIEGQVYHIAKEYLDNTIVVDIVENHQGYYEFYDEDSLESGLRRYSLIVQNEYGGTEQSMVYSIIITDYGRKPQFESFRWRLQ